MQSVLISLFVIIDNYDGQMQTSFNVRYIETLDIDKSSHLESV